LPFLSVSSTDSLQRPALQWLLLVITPLLLRVRLLLFLLFSPNPIENSLLSALKVCDAGCCARVEVIDIVSGGSEFVAHVSRGRWSITC
jgi:hypothetical protein